MGGNHSPRLTFEAMLCAQLTDNVQVVQVIVFCGLDCGPSVIGFLECPYTRGAGASAITHWVVAGIAWALHADGSAYRRLTFRCNIQLTLFDEMFALAWGVPS